MLTLCHVHQLFTPLVFSKTEIKAFGEHMVVSLRSSHFCSKVVAVLLALSRETIKTSTANPNSAGSSCG